jgi:hypothetical protein
MKSKPYLRFYLLFLDYVYTDTDNPCQYTGMHVHISFAYIICVVYVCMYTTIYISIM